MMVWGRVLTDGSTQHFEGRANRIHCDKSEEREVQDDFRFWVRATGRMDIIALRRTVVEQIL